MLSAGGRGRENTGVCVACNERSVTCITVSVTFIYKLSSLLFLCVCFVVLPSLLHSPSILSIMQALDGIPLDSGLV